MTLYGDCHRRFGGRKRNEFLIIRRVELYIYIYFYIYFNSRLFQKKKKNLPKKLIENFARMRARVLRPVHNSDVHESNGSKNKKTKTNQTHAQNYNM